MPISNGARCFPGNRADANWPQLSRALVNQLRSWFLYGSSNPTRSRRNCHETACDCRLLRTGRVQPRGRGPSACAEPHESLRRRMEDHEGREPDGGQEISRLPEGMLGARRRCAGASTATGPAVIPAGEAKATKGGGGREAARARQRACGEEWRAEKAAGKVAAGMKWPKYWSECNKRKKAAGT